MRELPTGTHPIVVVAMLGLAPSRKGGMAYTAEGVRALADELSRLRKTPDFPDAALALSSFAGFLDTAGDSPSAARTLIKMLAKVAPSIIARVTAQQAVASSRRAERFRQFSQGRPRPLAQELGAPSPVGTIPAVSLLKRPSRITRRRSGR